ncbi:hypothetical protein JW823_00665 [bacterium]|nr:hypothetical protein [candidate division CSSED10-310 bacterium]
MTKRTRFLTNPFQFIQPGMTFFQWLLLTIAAASIACAADLHVPADYPTIQAAVDAAEDADCILVADGVFSGDGFTNIEFKDITMALQSENGPLGCVIDCEHQSIFCNIIGIQTGTLTISGFTVINGSTGYEGGCAIRSSNSSPIIQKCNFFYNGDIDREIKGGALFFLAGAPVVDQCQFEFNAAGLHGGAIAAHSSEPLITHCTFTGNLALRGGAIYLYNSEAVIGGAEGSGNTFHDNWAPYGADLFSDSETVHDARNNLFDGDFDSDFYVLPGTQFDLTGSTIQQAPIESDVYVSPDGSDLNDGLSVTTPFKTIRYALSRLSAGASNPLTVHLSSSVFSIAGSGQTFPLPLLDHVRILGTGSDRTILDATGIESLFLDMHGNGCILEKLGLVNATGRAVAFDYGELTVDNCRFADNIDEGGLRIGNESYAAVSDSVFENNQSDGFNSQGSAIEMDLQADMDAWNCDFISNSAYYGGALHLNAGTASLDNCRFSGNTAEYGGSIATSQRCTLILRNSDISNSSAVTRGGAINCQGVHLGEITGCVFHNNTMPMIDPNSMGGAIYFGYQNGMESCTIRECSFIGNAAGFGGAVYIDENCPTVIENSSFEKNQAFGGGAIGVTQNGLTLGGSLETGNEFSGNRAGAGADLFSFHATGDVMSARFNVFDGNIQSDYFISPVDRFNLTGSTGSIKQVFMDMYVSPLGDDANSGITPVQPVRSLTHALRRIVGSETNPLLLHVAAGHYSELDTGETFPLPCLPWVTVVTEGEGSPIINGNGVDSIWVACNENPVIENMVLQGGNRAIMCSYNTILTLRDSWILNNVTGGSGGGIWSGWTGSLKMEHCRFSGNAAEGNGGAIYCSRNDEISQALQVWDCIFTGNSAANGGAISQHRGKGYIACCLFDGNQADYGGGYHCDDQVTTRIDSCLFTANDAGISGTALFIQSNSSPAIRYCTVTQNLGPFGGEAVLSRWSHPLISHCIVWNNAANEIDTFGYEATVEYSLVEGGYEGAGNIDADPLFTAGPMGAFYLSQAAAGQAADSPAVDAGALPADTAAISSPDGDVYLSGFVTRTDHATETGPVDLGYHYPETIPPPEPECRTFGCQIEMPSHYFRAGDDVYCRVAVCNSEPVTMTSAPVFVILELAGSYFFAPGFSVFDLYVMDLEPGETVIEVLPPFTWPEGTGPFDDACWYAAVTDRDITIILGVLDIFRFGWGE